MDEDLIRQVSALESQIDSMAHPEIARLAIDPYLRLPGLRGFWPMSAFEGLGNAHDQSGNGRLLTYNGNPTYNYDGFVPYIEFDGTGDFLERVDEPGFDITGTETYVASAVQGMAMGCWLWINAFDSGGSNVFMNKGPGGVPGNYTARALGGGTDLIEFSTAAHGTLNGGLTITTGAWFFFVGRFDNTGNTLDNWTGDTTGQLIKTSTAAAGALTTNNDTFGIGGNATTPATILHIGRVSLAFLCALALSDAIVETLYDYTRVWFS